MTLYRERLYAAPWLFAACFLVVPAVLLVFLPINPTVGVVLAVLMYLAIVAALLASAPVLEVTDAEFRAGRASVEREFVGSVQPFTGAEARAQRGVRLDARAWLLLRGSLPVVKVEITDADDPVPYWLVSTRRPHQLAEVLNSLHAAA
ncbi:DUF3093 domain-containing protein [Gryllotalpicola ginsengisoli]|uniref:DUF3093 domain-containing protein n=1 Tax=Gryllotalpicola ginsengisoli TaxID=444608 RepID=UPI00040B7247|nr:DUF3093 domain-containing protein [Gryllotalpicola ginsengisoli]